MEAEKKARLTSAGIDVDAATGRFLGNQDMYCTFLGKFLNDSSMSDLASAIQAQNITEAFGYAHTLKGVCANLSIVSMNEIINPMVEVLRSGSMDGVSDSYQKLQTVYDNLCAVIRETCIS